MSDEDNGRVALVQELMALEPGTELRLSYEDFDLLFPPELYGPRFRDIESPGHWCFDLAKDHGCKIRDDKATEAIVFRKIPMRIID